MNTDKINESLEEFFEEYFPIYDMNKYTEALLEWLEKDNLEIVEIK